MKELAFGIVGLFVAGVILMGSVEPQPSLGFTKDDYLQVVDNYFSPTYAWTIYKLCNPEDYKYLDGMMLDWRDPSNSIQSSKKLILDNYLKRIEIPLRSLNETCRKPYINETKAKGDICYNESIHNGTFVDYVFAFHWVPWDGTIDPKPTLSNVATCEYVMIYADLIPGIGDRDIDHFPLAFGFNYSKYDFWNVTWLARKTLDINSSKPICGGNIRINLTHESGQHQADFGDSRFLNNCSSTAYEIYQVNESITQSNDAIIWLNMTNPLTHADICTNVTICHYYDNDAAPDPWNLNYTFGHLHGDINSQADGEYSTQNGWSGDASYFDAYQTDNNLEGLKVMRYRGTTNNAIDKNIDKTFTAVENGSITWHWMVNGTLWYRINVTWETPFTNFHTCITDNTGQDTTCYDGNYAAGNPDKILLKTAGDPDYNYQIRLYDGATLVYIARFQGDNFQVFSGGWQTVFSLPAFDVPSNGWMDYFWVAKGDSANNKITYSFGVEDTGDTTPPGINIQEPRAITYNNASLWFNATVNESGGACVVDYGFGNNTMTNSSGNWNYFNNSMIDGGYTAIFWCDDLADNYQFNTVSFTVAACDYVNGTGDYNINQTCSVLGQWFNINGNLTIYTEGYLNMTNSTLNFTGSDYWMRFQEGSALDKMDMNGYSGIN